MNIPTNIQDELNSLNSNLPADVNGMPYTVPNGYFEGLAASVMAKIKNADEVSASEEIAQLSTLLAGISRTVPFSVPDHYFSSNIESLPAFTSENEASLVLSFISKEMPYQVPPGYFDGLSHKVLDKVSDRGGARVVPMIKRKWMHIAAAAMVAGIITISGISYFNNNGTETVTKDPVAVELKKATTEELKTFITNTDATVNDNTTVQNTAEVKTLLNDVSDKELEAFLDQVPTEDDEFELN